MPAPTKESLLARREEIVKVRDQFLAQAHAQSGAIAFIDEQIAQWDAPAPLQKPTDKPTESDPANGKTQDEKRQEVIAAAKGQAPKK